MPTAFIEGLALVASPYLPDSNFLRSVVYIVKHDADGAYGLILNRPTDFTVGQLLEQVLGEPFDDSPGCQQPIFHGGPVEGPVVIIHEQETANATLCEPGVYLSSDQSDFAEICRQSTNRFRVFSGYAGWAPGQLNEELKQGGWLVWKLSKEDLFGSIDEIWHTAVRQIGREILVDIIPSTTIPDDPSCN